MADYASTQDVIDMWRPLTSSELAIAGKLLPIISAEIRRRANDVNRDFDDMITEDSNYGLIAKSVCVDVVKRYINDNKTDSPAMSQMTQSAGGYSVSGTFLSPGGNLTLLKNELKRLGLKRQRYGVIDLYGVD